MLDTSRLPTHVDFKPPRRRAGHVLMVTDRCNLSCRYCYGDGGAYGSRQLGDMPTDIAMAAVDAMFHSDPKAVQYSLVFFGGEPLLNFSLIRRVVEYCAQRVRGTGQRCRYSITTNGTIMRPAILDFLRRHRFSVLVSCDGPPLVQDALRPFRNGRSSSRRLSATVAALLEAGMDVQLRATLVRGSVSRKHLDAVCDETRRLGARQVQTCPIDCNRFAHADLALREGEVSRLQVIYERISREHLRWARTGVQPPTIVFEPHLPLLRRLLRGRCRSYARCGACAGMTAVATDGTLFPCHRFVGWTPYAIGHVRSGVDPNRLERLYAALERAYQPVCDGCVAKLMCGGSCYYHSADGRGGFRPPSEEECESFRRSLDFAVRTLLFLRTGPRHVQKRYAELVKGLMS